MTLVISAAYPTYVAQTADRWITTDVDGLVKERDTASNKIVVFTASDAIVTMGYSGVAYIGLTPTDEWLASILWDGERVGRGPDGRRPTAITLGGRKRWTDLGTITHELKRSIEKALGLMSPLYITIAGWQHNRRRFVRPVVVELSKHRGQREVIIQRLPRHWYRQQFSSIHALGATVPRTEFSQRMQPFYDRKVPPTADELEAVFVALTRAVSERDATVGRDVISVVLTRPDLGGGRTSFLSEVPHLFRLVGVNTDKVVQVHFSPWVIANGRFAPAYNIGDQIVQFGSYQFSTMGAPGNNGILSLCFSLDRAARR